jgi:hypothetical protein
MFDLNQDIYHGSLSGKHQHFVPSKSGSFGEGIYFGDLECALIWGDDNINNITKARLNVSKPYFYQANYDKADLYDFDSFAIDLILELYSEQEANAIIDLARASDDGYFKHEIKERLVLKGYDCVVALYEKDVFEVVVFDNASFNVV